MATTTINVTNQLQDLQSVTDEGNITTNDINLDNSSIVLENSSRLESGTIDNGAGGGIARVCSIGYQDEWENGVQYFIAQNSNQIIWANSINNTIPDANFDVTMGYIPGSIFHDMNNQAKYQCTDNTDGAAVWVPFVDDVPNLQQVTDEGALTTNPIYVGDLSASYSEIGNGAVGTANVNNGTYAYIGQDGILGLHNGDVESQLKNTDVSVSNSVILEFPDKTSGSYTIATLDDISVLYSATFFDTTTQNNGGATTANQVKINTTQQSNGFTLSNNSIEVLHDGVYFINLLMQLAFTGGASNYNVTVWFTVDDAIVPNSGFTFTTTGAQNDQTLANITDTIALTSGQVLKFYWWSQATGMKLLTTAAGSNPTRPASPSVNFTIFNVG